VVVRRAFVAVFLIVEAALVATAGLRADRSYGFRMFPEASTVSVHVSRRLDGGRLVPLQAGRWDAKDCGGAGHRLAWGKMVRPPAPWRLDAELGAPYGVEASLEEARGALDYVASHTPEDCETRALVAEVTTRKNGGPPSVVTFEAARSP
jgi:hypothetical protein